MKLITLNTWGGRQSGPLFDFINKFSEEVDIFCFQEIFNKDLTPTNGARPELFAEISQALPNFAGFFRPFADFTYGLALFARKSLMFKEEGEVFVHKKRDWQAVPRKSTDEARNIQYARMLVLEKSFTIINFHGLYTGTGKDDTEDRLNQSRRIADFIRAEKGPVVLVGDFNLLPTTESVRILESAGMRNLVTEFGIKSTRTPLYSHMAASPFADYIFVSPGIKVNDFRVLPDVVSDHAPLFLDFEVV
jgi:endonuclease/exonuclease/phosphatase family metal-dependent hydrolase